MDSFWLAGPMRSLGFGVRGGISIGYTALLWQRVGASGGVGAEYNVFWTDGPGETVLKQLLPFARLAVGVAF